MSRDALDRLLNSVGKAVFVRYYHYFADVRVPDSGIVALLPQEYTLDARRTRTSKARRIFREGLQKEALQRIVASAKVDPDAAALAARLLASA